MIFHTQSIASFSAVSGRLISCLSLGVVGLLLVYTAVNGQEAGNANVQLNANPQNNPELMHILKNWEKAGEITKTLEGEHSRFVYDTVFNVKSVSAGKFFYQTPDKGRIDFEVPKNVTAGQQVGSFTLQPDKPERWICDGTQVVQVDDSRKEYSSFEIPEQNRGQNIIDGPLPFLVGITAQKIMMRYHVAILTQDQNGKHDPQNGMIHLEVFPLWKQDAANWRRAEILLDARKYLPIAVKLQDPSGNKETVYSFTSIERNPRLSKMMRLWKDPFKPNLAGYQKLQASNVAQQNNAGTGVQQNIQQVGGTR